MGSSLTLVPRPANVEHLSPCSSPQHANSGRAGDPDVLRCRAAKREVPSPHFGFNLLLTNNRIYYRKEPSEEHLAVLAEQIYEYLAKYEGLYQDELRGIFGEDYSALFSHG